MSNDDNDVLFELLEFFESLSSDEAGDEASAAAYEELSALRQRAAKLFGDAAGAAGTVWMDGEHDGSLPHGCLELHEEFVMRFEATLEGFLARRGMVAHDLLALVQRGARGGGWVAEAGKELVQLCHEAGDFATWASAMQQRAREARFAHK